MSSIFFSLALLSSIFDLDWFESSVTLFEVGEIDFFFFDIFDALGLVVFDLAPSSSESWLRTAANLITAGSTVLNSFYLIFSLSSSPEILATETVWALAVAESPSTKFFYDCLSDVAA